MDKPPGHVKLCAFRNVSSWKWNAEQLKSNFVEPGFSTLRFPSCLTQNSDLVLRRSLCNIYGLRVQSKREAGSLPRRPSRTHFSVPRDRVQPSASTPANLSPCTICDHVPDVR